MVSWCQHEAWCPVFDGHQPTSINLHHALVPWRLLPIPKGKGGGTRVEQVVNYNNIISASGKKINIISS